MALTGLSKGYTYVNIIIVVSSHNACISSKPMTSGGIVTPRQYLKLVSVAKSGYVRWNRMYSLIAKHTRTALEPILRHL